MMFGPTITCLYRSTSGPCLRTAGTSGERLWITCKPSLARQRWSKHTRQRVLVDPQRSAARAHSHLAGGPCRQPPTADRATTLAPASALAPGMTVEKGGSSGGGKVREEPEGMETEAALLEAFTEIPTYSAAWCLPGPGGGLNLTVEHTHNNLPANTVRKYLAHYTLLHGVESAEQCMPTFPIELKDVALLSVSPSGRRMLVGRAGAQGEGVVLEVWGGGRLLKELVVPSALHGSLYNDGWFGSGAAWSPDEQRLVYVAQEPAGVQTPQWSQTNSTASQDKCATDAQKDSKEAAPKTWRGIGEWQEDWGELNVGKKAATLFVLDLSSWRVQRVAGLPADTSCGQPTWTPCGDGLVFVAWPHRAPNFPGLAQRLGIVYCFNRPCALHAVAVPPPQQQAPDDGGTTCTLLTPGLQSAFCPRFSPDGQQLVFLSLEAACTSGVHCATAALHRLPWQQDLQAARAAAAGAEPDTIVPVVLRSSPEDFPGLYTMSMPPQPFVGAQRLVLSTQWRSLSAIVAVHLESGQVARVSPDDGANWALLAAAHGHVAGCRSKPNQPGELAVCTPHASAATGSWDWRSISRMDQEPYADAVQDALAGLTHEVLQLSPSVGPTDIAFEAVVVRRGGAAAGPAILIPHGGPHAALTASYVRPYAFLASLGYTLILVNFRGSTGYGEDSIQSLPGRIGEHDVQDCLDALDAAIAKGYVDDSRVAVVGGSHGGFLTGHLIGRHGSRFRAAVLRNPVMDLSLMVHCTDIPDWCYVEAFGTQEGPRRALAPPTAEDLARFQEVSPIAHVDRVTTPFLMMLGAKDARVPAIDAKRYVAAIRARGDGPPIKMFLFPEDTHALDKPQTEFEQFLNIAWWLKAHMAVES